jgi:tRNA-modifying protein YgfZ
LGQTVCEVHPEGPSSRLSIQFRGMEASDRHPAPRADWLAGLAALGATVAGNRVLHFGDRTAELEAARGGLVVCDLSHLGAITATGLHSDDFLQGQLSSDIRQLAPDRAQYSSYNTPKGRMLASFLVYRTAAAVHLQLPRHLVEPIRKRLAMFILRSRVTLADASDAHVRLGVAGADGEALVASTLGGAPAATLDVTVGDAAVTIRLPGDRFEIVAAPDQAARLWQRLAAGARPAGAAVWDWLEIRAGIPVVTAATQDQFVPQMVNLELVGGVSFQKGCYPGQEIVARTQYLGRLKRRMYLAHADHGIVPDAGTELYSRDLEGQASGTVVSAAPAPGGGFDLLAVIQTASVGCHPIHLGAPDGPVLQIEPLPYPVP